MKKIIMTGGGTAGHVTPNIALMPGLKDAGYDAQIVKNTDRNMYRVVATTFDDKAAAVQSRSELRATYKDAWLLFNGK